MLKPKTVLLAIITTNLTKNGISDYWLLATTFVAQLFAALISSVFG